MTGRSGARGSGISMLAARDDDDDDDENVLTFRLHFLKFTSCDNQALVGCIPIAAVAVHLNLKS